MKRRLLSAVVLLTAIGCLTDASAGPQKKSVVALSNSYFGNTWRRQMEALKQYPNAKVIGKVYGQATAAVAQSAVVNILPSLPEIDSVLTQGGGDDYGVVQASLQAGRKVLIVDGCGSSNFLSPKCIEDWVKQNLLTAPKHQSSSGPIQASIAGMEPR